ncbi:alpha/beta fold hydrolase [Derxia lacustris]|uniref:alpha/beta fold hydrolase n=1 Tax=Derxia lacustris TaxID=764842 RepID=UPI000A17521B|nr:alpha/beta hydrolase [Derxia lacustris]
MNPRPLLLALVLALGACASLPGSRTGPLAGREVEYFASHHAAPTLVFESGLDGRMEWWREVLPALCGEFSCLAYNRPGLGRSAPAGTPRDAATIVEELRATLAAARLGPPYVLVGHSLGGLYAQYFARRHPDEVAALVLVDSTHPRQTDGDGALERQPLWVRAALGGLVSATGKAELAEMPRNRDELLALPAPAGLPVTVLSAGKDEDSGTPAGRYAAALRRDIAALYPGSTQLWVDSGHGIPLEKPQAVIDAVRAAATARR